MLPAYRWRFAHLAALWGYGVSQPVFSMLKGNPEFLVVRGSTRLDVVTFALLVAFVVPLAVVGLEAIVSLASRTLEGVLHIVAIWCFGCLAVLQIVRLLDVQRGAALLIPLVPAALAALAYLKSRVFRSFLSVSVVLPVLGALSFVVTVPLATGNAAAANVTVARSAPVVLMVMDEFPVSALLRPDGTIDAKRYPNFARLAKTATWYPRATTVHEFTTQAVPAVLTGQLPHTGELPTLNDHPENLFTLLGARYVLRVIEPVSRLCPTRYCPDVHVQEPLVDRARGLLYDASVGYLYRVLPASLRQGLPPIGDSWGGFDDAGDAGTRQRLLGALDVNDVNLAMERADHQPRTEFARFMRLIKPGAPEQTLYFLHLTLPHAPYRLLPSGREYGNAETIDGIRDDAFNQWSNSPLLVDQARQRLLLQVGYTDRLIGDLVRRLEAAGLYDRALVVVTADHGASFHAGGFRGRCRPRTSATSLLCRYSSSTPDSTRALRTPATRRRSTSFRRSRTFSVSACPGRSTAPRCEERGYRVGAWWSGGDLAALSPPPRLGPGRKCSRPRATTPSASASALSRPGRSGRIRSSWAVTSTRSARQRFPAPRPTRRRDVVRQREEGIRVRPCPDHGRGRRRLTRRRSAARDRRERPRDRDHPDIRPRRSKPLCGAGSGERLP